MDATNVTFIPIQQLPPTHRDPFSTLLRIGDRLPDQTVVMRGTQQRRIKSKFPTTGRDNFNVLLEQWRDEDAFDLWVRNVMPIIWSAIPTCCCRSCYLYYDLIM